VKATIEAETPREDGRKTPRENVSGAAGEQRRVSMLQHMPFIPESPSRRTSFKLTSDGTTVMQETSVTEEEKQTGTPKTTNGKTSSVGGKSQENLE